ncbi:hypothetical protein M885DRAFT_529707 [Pelagophyceae sp. CCMP2097]|nr:hypothetical protein M885DRAFT_529707 [Pelagophyceae sp. CCMP2097]
MWARARSWSSCVASKSRHNCATAVRSCSSEMRSRAMAWCSSACCSRPDGGRCSRPGGGRCSGGGCAHCSSCAGGGHGSGCCGHCCDCSSSGCAGAGGGHIGGGDGGHCREFSGGHCGIGVGVCGLGHCCGDDCCGDGGSDGSFFDGVWGVGRNGHSDAVGSCGHWCGAAVGVGGLGGVVGRFEGVGGRFEGVCGGVGRRAFGGVGGGVGLRAFGGVGGGVGFLPLPYAAERRRPASGAGASRRAVRTGMERRMGMARRSWKRRSFYEIFGLPNFWAVICTPPAGLRRAATKDFPGAGPTAAFP